MINMINSTPQKWMEDLAKYMDECRRLKLDRSTNYYVLYFDSPQFQDFPVDGLLQTENFLKETAKKEQIKELEKIFPQKIEEHIALVNLGKGEILEDKRVKEIVKTLKKSPKKYEILKRAMGSNLDIREEEAFELTPPLFSFSTVYRVLNREKGRKPIEESQAAINSIEDIFENVGRKADDYSYNVSTIALSFLHIPSFRDVVKKGKIPKEKYNKNVELIDGVVELTKNYPSIFSQTKNAIEITSKDQKIIPETETHEIRSEDKETYNTLFDEAEKIYNGSRDLEGVEKILFNDRIRKGKVFLLGGDKLHNLSLKKVEFDEIVGNSYKENVDGIKRIFRLIEKEKPMGVTTLSQGPPGDGKTYTLFAGLTNLPNNARGFVVEISEKPDRFGRTFSMTDSLTTLKRIAEFHPDTYLVAAIDDVDRFVTRRGMERCLEEKESISAFLDLDSIYVHKQFPKNCVILLATNRPNVIDPAIIGRTGRIKYVFNFPDPDEKERGELTEFNTKKYSLNVASDVSNYIIKETDGLSCEDVCSIFKEADENEQRVVDRKYAERAIKQIKGRRKLTGSLIKQFGTENSYRS
jgi:AAA+ superfamily predicted ATPase